MAVHVPVLWPVCAHTIPFRMLWRSVTVHDDKYIYIFIRGVCNQMKPLWKVKGFINRTSWIVSDVQIIRYTWNLYSVSVSVSLCLSLCVVCCVLLLWCSWLWLWWRRGEGERLIEPSGPKFPSRLLKLNSFIR